LTAGGEKRREEVGFETIAAGKKFDKRGETNNTGPPLGD